MKNIFLCFQIHQPFRLRYFPFYEIGQWDDDEYFDEVCNKKILRRITENCYLPANKIILELIEKFGDRFKVGFSISGTALDQFQQYFPQIIESFKTLAETGNVEFLATSDGHSLCFQKSKGEFKKQALAHAEKIKNLFGQNPVTYRHIEQNCSPLLEATIRDLGFKVLLTEDCHRNPELNALEKRVFPDGYELQIMRKNHQLSDMISSGFSGKMVNEATINARNIIAYINGLPNDGPIVNLFLDYENFGEHYKAEKGVFDFLKVFPEEALHHKIGFLTPAQVISLPILEKSIVNLDPRMAPQEYEDLSFWLGNQIQMDAYEKLYALEDKVLSCKNLKLEEDWLYLQASDHFFYMNTDKNVGSTYSSPFDAYINFMNVLADFSLRLDQASQPVGKKPLEAVRQLDSASF